MIGELAAFFLMLGTVAFGGPAAHIAMMEEHAVRRHGWLTREEFLDLLGAANVIPGPSSTELAIFIGYRRAGWVGLVVAGVCFILPAFLLVTGIAWAYRRYGTLPAVAGILYGVKPVVIAIVVQALRNLAPAALKTRWLTAVAICSLVLAALGVSVLPVLAFGAVLAVLPRLVRATRAKAACVVPAVATAAAASAVPFGLWPLFLVFLKVGAIVFGSGYVLLVFLQGDLVDRLHWLTSQQLLDAVAVGQVTPGPVFTTATFVGFVLGGLPGAVVATVGIFLPSFCYVAVSGPLIPALRRSPIAGAALDGVTVASLALMAVVTIQLGRAALVDAVTIGVLAASLVLLFTFRINSVWLVAGGAAVGLVAALVNH
ncbi:MAG TPA: chromate efflux transporter [Gemmatimonadaceae bacterium]|nr:chromate efflux transporter [Gemmatimonadaceae bacterium]